MVIFFTPIALSAMAWGSTAVTTGRPIFLERSAAHWRSKSSPLRRKGGVPLIVMISHPTSLSSTAISSARWKPSRNLSLWPLLKPMKVGTISTPSAAYLYQKANDLPRCVGLIRPTLARQAYIIHLLLLRFCSLPIATSSTPLLLQFFYKSIIHQIFRLQ